MSLLNSMSKLAPERRRSGITSTGHQSSRNADATSARVVVIDDDADNRDALADLLESVGYVVAVYDGADSALAELAKTPPDLIVLDLMMPGMNGWQFRVEQKKLAGLRDVPVVVLSADASPYARAIDADAHVVKPIDFPELAAVIDRVLRAAAQRRVLAVSRDSERLRALNYFVASGTHEVNNLLSYVLCCLDLAVDQTHELTREAAGSLPSTSSLFQTLGEVGDGTRRIAGLVQLLAAFTKAYDDEEVDVVRAVQAAARIAQHRIVPLARFCVELSPVPPVVGSEARLTQAILNLLINAAHAVAETDGDKQVAIVTRREACAVVIEVCDTGPGIEPDLLERIFDPFFTSKPIGLGTGLGLTICRETITAMGGTLTAQSVLGQGATFRVTLPVARAPGVAKSDPPKGREVEARPRASGD